MALEWPPLGTRMSLRLKIKQSQLAKTLIGPWRMYCKPESGAGFSYGLVIDKVDVDKMTFSGGTDKLKLEDCKIKYDERSGRTFIEYREVWPDGSSEPVTAALKSNGKFVCEGPINDEHKASRQDLNLPIPSSGLDDAPISVRKYFLSDFDAVLAV